MFSRKKKFRKKLFIDPKVQGAMAIRVVFYWIGCILTICMMLASWQMFYGPARPIFQQLDDMWFFYSPALFASLILLPLIVYDMIQLSNKFAGPMFRLRRSIREIAAGKKVDRLKFRKGDFWHDFAEEFNELIDRIHGMESRIAELEGDAQITRTVDEIEEMSAEMNSVAADATPAESPSTEPTGDVTSG